MSDILLGEDFETSLALASPLVSPLERLRFGRHPFELAHGQRLCRGMLYLNIKVEHKEDFP